MYQSTRSVLLYFLAGFGALGLYGGYRLMYGNALPGLVGRVTIVRSSGEALGANSSETAVPEMFATQYFDLKIKQSALFSAKRSPAGFQLRKPDGTVVELFGTDIVRGHSIDVGPYLYEGGLSVNGAQLDQPGRYTITGVAQQYRISDFSFDVIEGDVSGKLSRLFIAGDIGDYSMIERSLGMTYEVFGSGQIQNYYALYTHTGGEPFDRIEVSITEGGNQQEMLETDVASEDGPSDQRVFAKEGNIYSMNRGEGYAWTSSKSIRVEVKTNFFGEDAAAQRAGFIQLRDAYLSKLPPDSL